MSRSVAGSGWQFCARDNTADAMRAPLAFARSFVPTTLQPETFRLGDSLSFEASGIHRTRTRRDSWDGVAETRNSWP